MRHHLVELGSALRSLWESLGHHLERFIWHVGHEWKVVSFVLLIAVALGAALWSLRSRCVGRAGG